jgi:hypothetical protein
MKMTWPEYGAPLPNGEQSMKKPNLTRVIIASFVIGVIGSFTGGLFSSIFSIFQSITDDPASPTAAFGFAVPGFISGFSVCFLVSIWFLSWMRNRGEKAIYLDGALFGAVVGALSASISVIFIDLVVRPGLLCGENHDSLALACIFFGIPPGAFIGFIAGLIITTFPGMILLRYVKGQPLKQTKSDSAPTEKK